MTTDKQPLPPDPEQGGREVRLESLVLPFYLPSGLAFLGAGMVMPILALYARSIGASVAGASFIVGLFGLGSLLFNIPAGLIITRLGKRPMILASTLLEGLIGGAIGFLRDPWALGGCVFLLGAVHTVFFVTRLAYFRGLVPAANRGRALALIGGENRFGQFLGPIAGGFIAETFGYRWAFVGYAAFMLVSLVFIVIWVPADHAAAPAGSGVAGHTAPSADSGPVGVKTAGTGITSIARTGGILRAHARTFATAGGAIIILQLLRTARQVLIPLWGEAIGLDVSQVGIVFGVMFLVELVLFYPAGMVMDRFGRKATAVPCLVVFALGFALIPLTGSYFALIIVTIVAGVGNGLGSGINMTLSTDFAPPDNPGEFIGVWRFIVDLGTAGGPFVVGVIAAAANLGVSCLAAAALGLAGAAVMRYLVPEPLARK
jgi:MFS family permease